MDTAFRNRAFAVSLVLVAGLSALSWRLLSVQSWNRNFSSKAQLSRFKMKETIPASRGWIVDRHRQPLAQNRPEAALIADANHLRFEDNLTSAVAHCNLNAQAGWYDLSEEDQRKAFRKMKSRVKKMAPELLREEHLNYALAVLSRELRVPKKTLFEKIQNGRKRIVVMKKIREDQARRIESELQARYIQGFSFERSEARVYPMDSFASHLIGMMGQDGKKSSKGISKGISGVEKAMDSYLQGRPGERELKRDVNGLVKLTESASFTPPMLGKHVQLTLHTGVQAIAEEELQAAMDHCQAERGTIIIVEPQTGDLLAMATRPHFDLNTREKSLENGRNFATQDQVEAGSVMKIIAMSAALDRGVANRRTMVNCGWGKITRPHIVVRDHHSYGDLTFDQVLMKSSNPGAFLFAEMVGSQGFYETLDAFGFGKRTGFPLSGEASGRISNRSNPQNFATASYGYGVSASPLQIAMAYAALANKGVLMKPRLIQSIIAKNGDILEERNPEVVRQVVSRNTAREMCLALETVVGDGTLGPTGWRAFVPGHRTGGKTGTAWRYIDGVGYDMDSFLVSFAGIVPVQNPRFVAYIMIDDPKFDDPEATVGGGSVAAPVFKRVAERVIHLLDIKPSEPIELKVSDIVLSNE